ncbi:cytochrome C biogenesis protein CcsB [Gallibacterium salpingitidis]|uniref:Cytochrome C biogenesis protein CcsB n=1 Tax=Gallibacterium salpingitidis TaxID=505341 RepID=A0AB36E4T9_9PAST|nr:cytochrome c [Gallibacterium salpingitidis]OBX09498.1 cytochrome C biogenesis protein CcsB [Gallibacterium salpingitidis]
MKSLTLILSVIILTTTTVAQANTDVERGKRLFNQGCALCHGKQGEKSALNQSAIINSLSVDEVVTALQKRKSGEIVGAGNAAKSRLNDDDMKAIAEYLQTLKK